LPPDLGAFDIFRLRALISSSQNHNGRVTIKTKINLVTWPIVNFQFDQPLADGSRKSEVSLFESPDATFDNNSGLA
jgi:hypothetical protein